VHLLLEPDEPGSGLTFLSNCSEDELDRSWQRLILTHLEEIEHVGVLTGSPITDMKITLIAGRAHLKHTEGGDFRQATYRAVRQGLRKASNVLLEPYYSFRLELPSESIGRAMSDVQRMNGTFSPPEIIDEFSVLTGCAPVATMRGYQAEVTAYSRGRGRLICTLKGYEPCHNTEEVLALINYDSDLDMDHPTSSVFCSHGVGFVVEWDKVDDYMHVEDGWQRPEAEAAKEELIEETLSVRPRTYHQTSLQQDKELEEIFVRTFGPIKEKRSSYQGGLGYEKKKIMDKGRLSQPIISKTREPRKEYLLVDGYNIIFSWEELQELAKENLDAARGRLMDILCNYQGFKKCSIILVFDAYKVKGGLGEVLDYHNISVVYTKEAETADQYIEKVTHDIARENRVTVATSDALEQLIILGKGAVRLSANDLKEEINRINEQIRSEYLDRPPTGRAYLGEQFDDDIIDILEDNK
jgi:predicted RNA-binding protein with PIN domain